jgi:hypothetical protein
MPNVVAPADARVGSLALQAQAEKQACERAAAAFLREEGERRAALAASELRQKLDLEVRLVFLWIPARIYCLTSMQK